MEELFSCMDHVNLRPHKKMIYSCPHCQTQNFVTPARLGMAQRVPLKCWKCGQKIRKSFSRKGQGKKRKAVGP